MELFKHFSKVLEDGNTANITIAKKGETLSVSVLPGNDLVKDAAKNKITPLNISGTAEELDEGFAAAFAPIKKAVGLLSDMASFEKSVAEAEAASKKAEAEKKQAEAANKSFKDYMALAKTNLDEAKYRDALTCVASAEKFATTDAQKTAVATFRSDVDTKSGAGTIFGGNEDKSDGKNITPGTAAPKGKKAASKSEDHECEEPDNYEND